MAILIKGSRLRARLRAKKMTQAEFAKRMGISQQMVSKFVAGEKIFSLEAAFNAADILECSVYDLYHLDDTLQ